MFVISQKIQTRKDLQVRRTWFLKVLVLVCYDCLHFFFLFFLCFAFVQDKFKKVKVKKETTSSAAIYKFEAKRKR